MKKTKKTALTAAVFAAAMGMTACSQSAPVSETESQPDVYFKQATEASNQKMQSSGKLGDINGDNKLSLEDNIMLQKYLKNKQKLTYAQYQRADYNQDGNVNIFDSVSQQKELIYGSDWIYRFTPQPDYGPPETLEMTEPTQEIPQPVYGPPEWFETSEPTETDYNPETDEPVCVYGPPEWFETVETTEPTETYDPSEDFPVDVYGPPEWFDPAETETETETEPEAYCVYGPPADWKE